MKMSVKDLFLEKIRSTVYSEKDIETHMPMFHFGTETKKHTFFCFRGDSSIFDLYHSVLMLRLLMRLRKSQKSPWQKEECITQVLLW